MVGNADNKRAGKQLSNLSPSSPKSVLSHGPMKAQAKAQSFKGSRQSAEFDCVSEGSSSKTQDAQLDVELGSPCCTLRRKNENY